MKKFILGTGFKMNKTMKEGLEHTHALMHAIKDYPQFEFFTLPPHTHLWKIKEVIDSNNSVLKLGAQNMHYEDAGQFTGEISPVMLKEIGIDLVEMGHSERREYFNETDQTVNLKARAALKHKMIPLICIGETADEKAYNVSKETLARQLIIALNGISTDHIGNFIIAYEPIWAIGVNGLPAPAEYVGEIHDFLRSVLVSIYGTAAAGIPLLFGGSVNIDNAPGYSHLANVDGLFMGRSGWDILLFQEIMETLSKLPHLAK